jgi:sodium transport system permease protein
MVNGAMYAAVDMTAGEKERRTMETLLSSAAHRSEIVLSKVLASAAVCLVTASLSVLTLVGTMKFLRSQSADAARVFDFPSDPVTLGLIGLALLPMTVLASSACVALATPARSTREAMSYVTPVMFLAILFAATAFIPGLDTNRALDFVPIANFARMMKQIVGGQWSWSEFGIALASNTAFAVAAVAYAVRKFQDERILFRV